MVHLRSNREENRRNISAISATLDQKLVTAFASSWGRRIRHATFKKAKRSVDSARDDQDARLFSARVNDNHDSPVRLLSRDLSLLHRWIHHRTRWHQKLRRPVAARLDLRGINSHHAHQVILHAISPTLTEI